MKQLDSVKPTDSQKPDISIAIEPKEISFNIMDNLPKKTSDEEMYAIAEKMRLEQAEKLNKEDDGDGIKDVKTPRALTLATGSGV